MTKKSIGTSPPRKDAIEKVTGQGIFVADLKLPGMLHIAVVRSTEPHAVIERIDTAEALNMPGVVTVVTGENCTLKVGHCIVDQPPMATGKVRYVGEPVAAVVAETKEQAVLAADKVQVSYLALPAVLKARDALKDGAPIIHEDLASYHSLPGFNKVPGTNVFHHYKLRKGDVAEGFEKADLIVENEFTFPHSCHGALEPHGAIALFDPEGKLTVWASSQSPFTVRNFLGAMFGIPLHQVRVIVPYLGGGFGCKSDTTIEPLVAWIARHAVGRPVRLILSREEVFCGSVIGRGFSTISRIGFDREGNITAAEVDIACSSGAYGENSINIVVGGGHNATGPYEIPNVKIDSRAVYTNTPIVGAFRGYGHPEAHWMMERQMDVAARKLGIDHIELRRRNLLKPGSVNNLGQTITEKNGDLESCLDAVLKSLDIESNRKPHGSIRYGKGIGCLMKSPVMATNAASGANVRFNEDGTVQINMTGSEMGQGSMTALCQIAAETLKVPVENVRINAGSDTLYAPYEWQSVASSTTWKVGNAIDQAARRLIEVVKSNAALVLGCSNEDLEYDGEKVFLKDNPEKSIPLQQLTLGYMYPDGHTVGEVAQAYGSYLPIGLTFPDSVTGGGNCAGSWTFGCQGAEVAVDIETGEIKVQRFITAMDIGRVINPQLARGQITGAVVQAMGGALTEKIIYSDQGQIRNATFTDYKMPTPKDIAPDVLEVIFLENPDEKSAYGNRLIAEHGTVSVAPTIANAVRDAVGLDFFELPMDVCTMLERLKDSGVTVIDGEEQEREGGAEHA